METRSWNLRRRSTEGADAGQGSATHDRTRIIGSRDRVASDSQHLAGLVEGAGLPIQFN